MSDTDTQTKQKEGQKKIRLTPTQALTEYKQEEKKKRRDEMTTKRIMSLYVVPIVVIAVFAGIIFGLITPQVDKVFGTLNTLDAKNQELTLLNDKLNALRQLSAASSVITADLASIETIVPEKTTEVVKFQRAIRQLAQEKFSLDVVEAVTGEKVLRTTAEDSASDSNLNVLAIIEIPSTFTMSGDLANIKAFIQDIKSLSDFVIIGKMELSAEEEFTIATIDRVNTGRWNLIITLVKYQFQVPDEANKLDTIYAQVPETVQASEEVLTYVRAKTGTSQ